MNNYWIQFTGKFNTPDPLDDNKTIIIAAEFDHLYEGKKPQGNGPSREGKKSGRATNSQGMHQARKRDRRRRTGVRQGIPRKDLVTVENVSKTKPDLAR